MYLLHNILVNTSEDSDVAEIAFKEVATTNGMKDEEADELIDQIFGSVQVEETIVDVEHEFNSEEDMLF